MTEYVNYETQGQVGVISIANPPVNALSVNKGVLQSILDFIKLADHDPKVQAILLIGSGKNFSGGADISEFGKPKTPGLATLADVLNYLDTVTKPVVAGISGPTMGGGLELALTCHYRIASPKTILALPEVKLGILPGGGGTQRLPRIVGAEVALDIMTTGRFLSVSEATKLGLVDATVEGELLTGAVDWIKKSLRQELPIVRASEKSVKLDHEVSAFVNEARGKLAKRWRGFPAPLAILDCVHAALTMPFKDGLKVERREFEKLVASNESKSLRHLFFAERQANKVEGISKDVRPMPIETVAVVGAGTMGGGIAMNFLNVGIPVTLIDMSDEAVERGLNTIKANYEATVKKGRLSEQVKDERLGLLATSSDLEKVASADLIIEAVFEEMDIKRSIFKELDDIAKPNAILATNTSTLDINKIAEVTNRPEKVIGLHFFSPANVMQLLEVVRAEKTGIDVIATSMAVAKIINKVPVCVGICDGFVGNRMIHRYIREAEYIVEEGAMPQEVDHAIESLGFAMGPFRMCDLAGLDIGWAIRKRKRSEGVLPERYVEIPDALCERGWFGQKTGRGYYIYEKGSRVPKVNPEVERVVLDASNKKNISRRNIASEEIIDRLMFALINEGSDILSEGIAQRASDIDVIYAYGYGFPRYHGGPMFYAETHGLSKVVQGIERLAKKQYGDHWRVSDFLKNLAKENGTFNDN